MIGRVWVLAFFVGPDATPLGVYDDRKRDPWAVCLDPKDILVQDSPPHLTAGIRYSLGRVTIEMPCGLPD